MPYSLSRRGEQWCVVKKASGKPIPGGCHKSKKDALNHLVAVRESTKE